jgi:hypothetical protein
MLFRRKDRRQLDGVEHQVKPGFNLLRSRRVNLLCDICWQRAKAFSQQAFQRKCFAFELSFSLSARRLIADFVVQGTSAGISASLAKMQRLISSEKDPRG